MLATVTSRRVAQSLYDSTDHILGQDRGRKQMAVLMERQYLVREGILPRSSGAILAGRTGTGKTYLARTMCKLSGLPYAEVNATQYTERGYVGMDMPQMFLPLMESAARLYDAQREEHDDTPVLKRDDLPKIKEMAQRGVIVLDELDKWMMRRNHVTGERDTHIQAELLKMVEGSQEYVSDDADEVGTPFDTTRVLIICAGAFVRLPAMVSRRLHRPVSGQFSDESFWDLIEPGDFVRFGMIPELAGRLSTHIFMRPLKVEHLVNIMLEPGGIVQEYRERFESLGVQWDVHLDGIRHLADIALSRGTGARGVEHVIWGAFSQALFEAEGRTAVQFRVNDAKARLI